MACLVEQVQASSIRYNGVGFNDGNNGLIFGIEFTPGVNIDVTMLGVFDGGMDGPGLEVAHDVGLFSAGLLVLSSNMRRANDDITVSVRFSRGPISSTLAPSVMIVVATAHIPEFCTYLGE